MGSGLIIHLRSLSKLKGFTQYKLAERTGISRVAINRFFNNRSQLRAGEFLKLLKVLDIDVERLIYNEHSKVCDDTVRLSTGTQFTTKSLGASIG